ncbi:MAG: carbamoyltransferase HypF [Clostridia bacterium]|nr:carbamoyltransferase HypF [Clostridia bacterium]
MIRRARFAAAGIVQGVGFRPFLHRLARECGLVGFVRNTGFGVAGEIEGDENAIAAFYAALTDESLLPPLAVVTEATLEPMDTTIGETAFTIEASAADGKMTLVSPDIGTCPQCLRELHDRNDRRYRYPFINCTNCGPRFTIIKSVPYDRPRTTMAHFPMCGDCAAEYADIENRRYHAQPDCCPVCGPRLWFADEKGKGIDGDAIAHTQALLRRGGILAIKGLGGFHLACTIDQETVEKLRARKRREEKPLAILCRDMDAARSLCIADAEEEKHLTGARKPIVLLQKRERGAYMHLSDNDSIGVMLPYTPVHELLVAGENGFSALVLTSANASELPAVITNENAIAELAGIADGFLLHNREIESRCDDSLLRVVGGEPYFVRRSRGYAPQPVPVHMDAEGILALGAEQKASFAMGKGKHAFYSQHIGDLKNAETLEHYETQIARFKDLFGIVPKKIVCDLHPDYLSTRWGKAQGLPVLAVQHHHAHMASCMADNGLEGECIGVIWDGTGLGEDGTIWGGEFFTGGYEKALRMGSIRPILLPGGDAAIKQIGRIAMAMRWDAGLAGCDPLTAAMLDRRINCPPSSGMGRLFDGVYALLSGRQAVSYEGQGAVLLEALAGGAPEETGAYPVAFYEEQGVRRFDWRMMIRQMLKEKLAGEKNEVLAMRFHNTLIQMACMQCEAIHTATQLTRVALSGGVFFNQILLRGLMAALEEKGFEVFCHRRVSTGDEGLALGQLAVGAIKEF